MSCSLSERREGKAARDRSTEREKDIQKERPTERDCLHIKSNRRESQSVREPDRETERQRDRETERQRTLDPKP
eukprot:3238510-Rhodomonas_salina.2